MKKTSVIRAIISVTSLLLLFGCSILSEEDLQDLQSPNAMSRKESLQKLSERVGFPRSLMATFFEDEKDNRAVALLLEILKNDEEPKEIQIIALKALARMADRTEIPVRPLIDILAEDRGPRVHTSAITTLGQSKNAEAVPVLLKHLQDNAYLYVTIWALGEIGSTDAVFSLNQQLNSDDMYARYNARRALEKIADSVKNGDSPNQTPISLEKDSEPAGGLIAFGRMVFQKYQDIMTVVFYKIAGR